MYDEATCRILQAKTGTFSVSVVSSFGEIAAVHIVALHHSQFGERLGLFTAMFELRRRVFRERLEWAVSVSGNLEIDVYDTLSPVYILLMSEEERVVGSVRLLPTIGPTMLAQTFASLLEGQAVPVSAKVFESSRFCVDTRLASEPAQNGLRRATCMLFAGMLEFLIGQGGMSIVTVTDVRLERILRRAGWPLERITAPRRVGETMALAGFLHASDDALQALYRCGGTVGPVTVDPQRTPTGT